jgi:solute carrier family 12 sodium/potassium/chloride transporter 2
MFFQDPQGSIPKGTLLSILLTTISYVGMAIMAGAVVERHASGNVTELYNGTYTDCTNRTCKWGLHNSFQVSIRYYVPAAIVLIKFTASYVLPYI